MKISKELICEVLKIEPTWEFNYHIEDNYIVISDFGEQLFDINIYEFVFKCKEWALSKGYYINCFYNEFWWDRVEKKYTADIPNKNKSFYKDTEIEAILEACNWILKEI